MMRRQTDRKVSRLFYLNEAAAFAAIDTLHAKLI